MGSDRPRASDENRGPPVVPVLLVLSHWSLRFVVQVLPGVGASPHSGEDHAGVAATIDLREVGSIGGFPWLNGKTITRLRHTPFLLRQTHDGDRSLGRELEFPTQIPTWAEASSPARAAFCRARGLTSRMPSSGRHRLRPAFLEVVGLSLEWFPLLNSVAVHATRGVSQSDSWEPDLESRWPEHRGKGCQSRYH